MLPVLPLYEEDPQNRSPRWVCRLGPLASSSPTSSRRRSNVRFLANRVLSGVHNRPGSHVGQLSWLYTARCGWTSWALTLRAANHQNYNRPHAHLARAQDDMRCDWSIVYTSAPEWVAICMGNFGEPLLPFAKASKPTLLSPVCLVGSFASIL